MVGRMGVLWQGDKSISEREPSTTLPMFLAARPRNIESVKFNLQQILVMIMDDFDERFFDTDQNGVLKVPFVLWLGLAIHTRHWVLVLLSVASMAVGAASTVAVTSQLVGFGMAAAQLPSLLVVVAATLRQPEARGWVRVVWANGYKLMTGTALLNLMFVMWWLVSAPTWNRWPELYLASTALLDLVIAYWAFSQALPRKVFSEFPTNPKPK
jgi:Protein of unknown function (DUF2919)